MRLVLLLPAALAACVGMDGPTVSEFNGSSVKIVSHPYPVGNDPRSPVYQKAAEICGKIGKKAEAGSVTPLGNGFGEHLYLCL